MNAGRRRALAALSSTAAGWWLPRAAAAREAAGEDIVALAAARSGASLYKASARRVSRSTDGGRTWRILEWNVKPGARIHSISVSAADPALIYASGPGLGVIRSVDEGASSDISHGLPRQVTAVAAHSTQADTIYAYARGRGIYRSDDAGAKWRLMDAGPRGGIERFVHSNMPGSMQTGWLFAAGAKGVRLSMDCFCGWRDAGDLASPAHAIACDPHDSQRVAAATARGIFESANGGQAWSKLAELHMPITALAFTSDGTLHAAGGTRVYRRSGASWEALDA